MLISSILLFVYVYVWQDNVLVFEYKSKMRHLIGVQASMTRIAQECFPELKVLS